MNNNNNNDLFDMFGIEEPAKEVENNNNQQKVVENTTQQPVKTMNNEQQPVETMNNEQQSQQTNNTPGNTPFVKPIPDEVMAEINAKKNDDKELLKIYIGQNFEGLAYGGFSFCTFFFGPSYLVYRKQYGSAFILIILNILLSLSPLLMETSIPLILVIINIIVYIYFSASFKSTYVATANDTINRIMLQKMSKEEKHELIRKAGGVDNRAFIVYVVMIIISSAISSFVLLKTFI